MASMTMTKARECPECGQVHDCQMFQSMNNLIKKMDEKIDEYLRYINTIPDYAEEITAGIPELEDK